MAVGSIVGRHRWLLSIGYWIAIAGIIVIADPGSALSTSDNISDCTLAPISEEIVAGALAAEVSGSGDEHIIPFPPPLGEPIDYFEAAKIQAFIDQYTDCLNAGETSSRYSVYSADLLERIAATDPDEREQLASAIGAEPIPLDDPVVCTLIRAWTIESSHVVAVVQVFPDAFYNTLLLVPIEGGWMVDDRWNGVGEELLLENGTGPLFARPMNPDAENAEGTPKPVRTRKLW